MLDLSGLPGSLSAVLDLSCCHGGRVLCFTTVAFWEVRVHSTVLGL